MPKFFSLSILLKIGPTSLFQTRNPYHYFPHVRNGEFFEGDEGFGVERGSHEGGRILYLGVIAKEKAPPLKPFNFGN